MAKGIIGRKLGMTQVFVGGEDLIPVTVVQAGPCTVVQKKTKDVDGYDAIQVGFGDVKPHRVTRPLLGHYKKSGAAPTRFLREFQVENIDEYEVGQVITADIFKPGDRVDVVGISKGKGFQGGMKRHGFAGGRATHGSMFHRAPGAISAHEWPAMCSKARRWRGTWATRGSPCRTFKWSTSTPRRTSSSFAARCPGPRTAPWFSATP
jgi:large subunit ribosomal protein L3